MFFALRSEFIKFRSSCSKAISTCWTRCSLYEPSWNFLKIRIAIMLYMNPVVTMEMAGQNAADNKVSKPGTRGSKVVLSNLMISIPSLLWYHLDPAARTKWQYPEFGGSTYNKSRLNWEKITIKNKFTFLTCKFGVHNNAVYAVGIYVN